MACTVEKSNAPAIPYFGRETATGKEFLNRFVDGHSVNASLDFLQRQCLPGFHRFPKFPLRFARPPAQHCASHVAEISGGPVAWENVQADKRICVERNVASLVRVASLIASGHNRAVRAPPGA